MVEENEYEQFREKYQRFREYAEGRKAIAEGRYPEFLVGLVEREIDESIRPEDKDIARQGVFQNFNNPLVIVPLIENGTRRTKEEYVNYGKNNLEGIINRTPIKELRGNLFDLPYPKEEVKDYEDIYKLHSLGSSLKYSLKVIRDPNIDVEQRNAIERNLRALAVEHYFEKYKDKKDIANFFGALISYTPNMNLILNVSATVLRGYESKLEEIEESKLKGYIKELSKKEEVFFGIYSSIFEKSMRKQ